MVKKGVWAAGTTFVFLFVIFAMGLYIGSPTTTLAQTQPSFNMVFQNLPTDNVSLSTYVGLDRKLKAAPGQTLEIVVTPPLTAPRLVYLQARVSIESIVGVDRCLNASFSATTRAFEVRGSGRVLTTNDFSGSSSIGIASSEENSACIDALADKIQQGVASLPSGIYVTEASLYDAQTHAQLGPTARHTITIAGSSATEAVINLTAPTSGEQLPQSPQAVFIFDTSIPGRLLAFEHSNLLQSPEDATRDLNSPLKIVDVPVSTRGTHQVTATYPGLALRPWLAGKKISWLFLGTTSSGGGATETRRSPVWSFTIISSDPNFTNLLNALSGAPDPIGSTFANLLSSGYMLAYSTTNPIRIQEGDSPARTIDISQVLALLNDLARRNVRLNAQIVSE
ncbi:MAG: hypothetical protein FJ217_11060 [Ignavibacteria bacterium]|nr:hypothetical protein [Ignavibacteria bacterium]